MTRDDAFRPSRLLRNRHLQSLGAALPIYAPPRDLRAVPAEVMRIPIPGGGALHARAWWHARQARSAVIVIHGVGGSSESQYVIRAAAALYRAGYHVVRLDLRGAGGSIEDAPLLYHAGLTEDPKVAIAEIAKRANVKGVAVLGFSLGGNVTLRLAAEWGNAPPADVKCVATVSAPLDLVDVSYVLEKLKTLPYRFWLLKSLMRQGRAFAAAHPGSAKYDATLIPKLRTIRAYDELVIAPMHDFASAHDYYARESSGPGLPDVTLPTLIVHADDDPIVPGDTVRPWLRYASRAVQVAWSERGGHVGWFDGVTERAWVSTWAMERVMGFFEKHGLHADAP